MRAAAVREPGSLELVDVPDPEPGPYQVLARILTCGICGTDVHILRGRFQVKRYPCLLGHETIGRVLQVGPKVRSFSAGDLVLRVSASPPGGPAIGGYASMWSGFSDYGLAFDQAAFKADHPISEWGSIPAWADSQQVVPTEFDPADAGMFITLKETLSFLDRVGLGLETRLVITGTGPAALAMVGAARILGAKFVGVYGRRPSGLALAERLGADAIADSLDEVQGKLPASFGENPDLVVECTGDVAVLERASAWIGRGGRVGLYALYEETHFAMPLGLGDRSFVRASPNEGEMHARALNAVRLGQFDLKVFATRDVPLEDIWEAFDLIERREAVKVAVRLGK